MSDQSGTEASGGRESASIVRAVVPDAIRRRFTLKFALILVLMGITVGLIGATATGMLSSAVEHNVEQEYEDLATQKANVVEKWVQRNTVSVKLASKNEVLSRDDGDSRYDMRRELATTSGNLYGVQAIYVINQSDNGTTVVASPQLPYDTDISKTSRHWVKNLSLDRMDVLDVRITEVHEVVNTRVIAFISPVQDSRDRYLVIEYDVERLAELLDEGRDSRFTQVVEVNGTVQVASRSSEQLRPYGGKTAMKPVRRAQGLSDAGERTGVIARAPPDPQVIDEEYTVGYAPVEVENTDLKWTVLVHEPTRVVFGFVNEISLWGRFSTVAGMTFIVLIGAAIGYSTTRDINRLRVLAEQLQAGNLDVTVSSPRIDSIGQLYDGFDDMRVSLKHQIEEVERARKKAEISRAEAMEMNAYLQSKAEEYSEIMRLCAAGDLTQRLETDGENEAMDRIATEFNDMVEELEANTGQVKHFAAEVEDAGEILQSSSDSVRVTSEHVADSIGTISADASDQKERLETVAEEIDDVVEVLDEYTEEHEAVDFEEPLAQFNDIARMVSDVAAISEKTQAESELVAGAAEKQAAELNAVSARAADLTEYARPLRDVLDTFETDADGDLRLPTTDDEDHSADETPDPDN